MNVMRARPGRRACAHTRACLALLSALVLLAACGGEGATEAPSAGRWYTAKLEGITRPSGIAVLGRRLLIVAGSDHRQLHVLERADLRPDVVLSTTSVPIEADPDAHLTGGEDFATHGYRLGDLWSQPLDFQGIAIQSPDHVFLADRAYRVVYVGRLHKFAAGTYRRLHVHRVFVVPGGNRRDASASDWRDQGQGLAGLTAVEGRRRTEDLYVVDRGGEDPSALRIHKLDRFGMGLAWFTVDLGREAAADVGGLSWDAERFLLIHGTGRGALVPAREGRWRARVKAGKAVPGPEVAGAGPWRGLAHARDGTMFLVSGGEQPVLAWRPR